MKGNVIGFDAETNTGAISGHDGHRYEFATADWHSHHRQPQHGDLVDFAPEGHEARQIYLIEPEYIAPTFGQFYFSARGRISRSQYWLRLVVPVFVIFFAIGFIKGFARAVGDSSTATIFQTLSGVLSLVMLWPEIVVLIKRIHDRDKSGALVWALYGPMIPAMLFLIAAAAAAAAGGRGAAIGLSIMSGVLWIVTGLVGIWFFIEFGCMRGTIGANRYGPDPVGRR
jgi:uncharacterized membrane protein YhaH (DUF805 family)